MSAASRNPPASGARAERGAPRRRSGAARPALGAALLVLLCAAALLSPEETWDRRFAPGRALVEGAGPWLPAAFTAALVGGVAGAALACAGRLPALRATDGVWRSGVAPALAAGLLVAAIAGLAFGGAPIHVDAVVLAFQGRILREGAAFAPAPPLTEFFVTLNTGIEDGRWLGQFPPGFPLLLALAGPGPGRVALHAIVAAGGVYAVFGLGAALYGSGTGLLAAALLALSPFALLLSASGLNHAAAAAAAAVALWAAVEEGRRDRPSARALLCGAALGALVAIRPLDGAVAAAAVLPVALRAGSAARRGALLAAGLLPALALLAFYDWAVTGSAAQLGYTRLWGPAHGLGFHLSPWGEPHTLRLGLLHLHRDLWLLNAETFGAALPLLPFAAVPLLAGASPAPRSVGRAACSARAGEIALHALLLGIPAVYVFYWHHDWFLGPRYLFTALPFFCLLAARGLTLAAAAARGRRALQGALLGALAAGGFWLLAHGIPGRLGPAFAMRLDFRADVAREARERGIREGVVFVKESWGSRLLARLRGRGLTPSEAERAYRTADHCVLELLLADPAAGPQQLLSALRAERRRLPAPVPDPRRNGDPTLRLRPGGELAPACGAEIAYDRAAPYGSFTPQLARLDPWLRDSVVVARDLRGENPRLLAALRRAAGYLYVPGRLGSAGTFLPLPGVQPKPGVSLVTTHRHGEP